MNKKHLLHFWYFAAAIFGIIVLQQLWAAKEALQVNSL
jgi:hypothetical protein